MSTEPANKKPKIPEEAGQFDFWVGEWDLTWGEEGRGSNRISKILDGRVIEERFSAEPAGSYQGLSVSLFDLSAGCWKQTWVDSSGAYLDFSGGMAGGQMILSRETVLDDRPILQRMIWYDITTFTLEWEWQRSDDNGLTWHTLWHIHYRRKPI